MANGILQSDGTRCWSGATCRKHAGAVFKDSQGNVSTREGLQKLVSDALEASKFEVYAAERENLERIEHELSVMEELEAPVNTFVLPYGVDYDRAVWSKFLLDNNYSVTSPSRLNRVGNGNADVFEPNAVEGSAEELRIFDTYAASATLIGLKSFAGVLQEQSDQDESLLFQGDKGGSVVVPLWKLTRVKRNAADAHVKWRARINKHVEDFVKNSRSRLNYSQESRKSYVINDLIKVNSDARVAVEARFVKARFEMLYARKHWSHASDADPKVGAEMVERLCAVQRLHDEVYFSRLQERELKALLK